MSSQVRLRFWKTGSSGMKSFSNVSRNNQKKEEGKKQKLELVKMNKTPNKYRLTTWTVS